MMWILVMVVAAGFALVGGWVVFFNEDYNISLSLGVTGVVISAAIGLFGAFLKERADHKKMKEKHARELTQKIH